MKKLVSLIGRILFVTAKMGTSYNVFKTFFRVTLMQSAAVAITILLVRSVSLFSRNGTRPLFHTLHTKFGVVGIVLSEYRELSGTTDLQA